jgi:NAD(P)-dependent dehydrogenase (short-subunit alcohol dehydrogenase family)
MNRIALVIGGTSGIGLATARVLADHGAQVVIAGRDAERGQRAASQLGDRIAYMQADVAIATDVQALVERTIDRCGRLDWAVNAAALGSMRPAPLHEISEAEWDERLAVDLKGVWLCMKHEIAAMGKGGSIVNVSSVNGLSATPMAAAYCAAKHGIIGLTKTAALEQAASGIRVNVVCPGAHRTPMLEGVFASISPDAPDDAEAMYRARIPVGRIGDPQECARAIAWLLSDSASYVTGAVLTVDGGLALGAT